MISWHAVTGWATALALQIGMVLFGCGIERLRPGRSQGFGTLSLNLRYLIALRIIYAGLNPACLVLTSWVVGRLGGGWITLPSSGWGLMVAIPLYALTMDGAEYLFHRAQHRIPVLWTMHSLHHSDQAVNTSTAPRHFWAEMVLKSLTIYALAGLLFKTNPVVIGAYLGLGLYNYVLHMNIALGFGRFQPLLNSPQFHRLHHSALPQHQDCNFNQFFPVFDLLFGTYRRPGDGEFPPTGLSAGDPPLTLREMLLWPWLRLLPDTPAAARIQP